MTASRITAALVASLALAVPSVTAAAATKPKPHTSIAHKARASAGEIFTAPFPSTPIRMPSYIYVPPAPATSTPSGPTCMSSGEYCTPAEACEYWGENCF